MHAKRRLPINVFGSKLQFFIRFVSWSLLLIVTLAVISLHFEFWILDVYVSYIPQIFIFSVTLFILMVALYGRYIIRDGWAACWDSIGFKEGAMFVLASSFTLYIAVYSLTIIEPIPVNAISHNLTVGTYNIRYTNEEIFQAAYFFESNKTDVVVLQEARAELVEEAKSILGYDYVEITDCSCSAEDTEVAIISSFPLSNTELIAQHQNGAIIRTEAQIDDDTKVAIYGVHIPPPVSKDSYQLRNQFIDLLTIAVINDKLKTVVAGDFNTTIFSPSMHNFIDNTSTRIDNTAEAAWPACSWFGLGQITCARIDHIFVSRQFGVGKREIGPGFGSDHRPLTAQLLVN